MSNYSSASDFQDWIGREETSSSLISPDATEAMGATLDLESHPTEGQPLPPGWQWLFFNPKFHQAFLVVTDTPQKADFFPPSLYLGESGPETGFSIWKTSRMEAKPSQRSGN